MKPKLIHYLLSLTLAVGVMACTKEPDRIGTNVIPPSDRLPFGIDTTIVLEAFSVREDSVRTDETSQNVLGSYWDPVFGITTASIYTQLRLPFTGHSFGDNPVIDSAVLTLALKGGYGDSTSIQTIKVFELSDTLSYEAVYYSNQTVAYYPTELISKTFIARPYDSVMVDTVKTAPHIRLRLDQAAPGFINKILTASTDQLSQNESFLNHIKGIYITAEIPSGPGKGTLMYINLESALSELALYYHNNESDSLAFSLVINSSSARFNHFNHHGYTEADAAFKQQVIGGDTLLGKQKLYTQAMAGVKTYIKIPDLNLGNGKKVAIAEARLELTNADASGIYAPPASLILYEEDTAREAFFLEEQYQGDSYFGGSYDASQKSYFFRIPRYIQNIINGNRNKTRKLYLLSSSASVRGNRLIFYGTEPVIEYNQRLRLRVIYTHLP